MAWVQARALESQVEFAQMPARIGSGALAALGAIGLTMAMVGLLIVGALTPLITLNRGRFDPLALGAVVVAMAVVGAAASLAPARRAARVDPIAALRAD